ncbi:hypothetical protein BDY24DRAFT_416039 [Mrakia frigida]|uniref:uncharacterized protein n=1 Tax=Mrakia frigida TaxID=29902 RepID=UPI003FCBF711
MDSIPSLLNPILGDEHEDSKLALLLLALSKADHGEKEQRVGFPKPLPRKRSAKTSSVVTLPPSSNSTSHSHSNPHAPALLPSSASTSSSTFALSEAGRSRKRVDYTEPSENEFLLHKERPDKIASSSKLRIESPKQVKRSRTSSVRESVPETDVGDEDENSENEVYDILEVVPERKPRGPPKDRTIEIGSGGKEAAPKKREVSDGKQVVAKSPGKIWTDEQIAESLLGKITETQMGTCKRNRYARFPKCTQCIAHITGDSCRFRSWRTFQISPATAEIFGKPFFPPSDDLGPVTIPLVDFNIDPNGKDGLKDMQRVKLSVANALIPRILRELKVWTNSGLPGGTQQRVLDPELKSTCDFCALQIFGGSYPCLTCGRDFCLECFQLFPPANPLSSSSSSNGDRPPKKKARLEESSAIKSTETGVLARLLRCGKGTTHTIGNLAAVSRFSEQELRDHLLSMAELCVSKATLSTNVSSETAQAIRLYLDEPELRLLVEDRRIYQRIVLSQILEFNSQKKSVYCTSAFGPSIDPVDPSKVPSHKFFVIGAEKVASTLFESIWTVGDVLLMKRAAADLDLTRWSKAYWIEACGDEKCQAIDAQTGKVLNVTIRKFFDGFGDNPKNRSRILKLKDWPPTNAFKNKFPRHYAELMSALPLASITRRDGVQNVSAYSLHPDLNPADIGPKIYAAYAGNEGPGGNGSTRLHMDLADAVNIMVYAEKSSDGRAGCAAWDIYRSQDSDKIRSFLKNKFSQELEFEVDPIHSQRFYLDAELKAELFKNYGVRSFRIYQYVSHAVFIPAGCAHQVCNLADCIKVALDFISPENVRYCEQLSSEFRDENSTAGKPWKEDVLAYNNTMFNAWLASKQLDKARGTPYVPAMEYQDAYETVIPPPESRPPPPPELKTPREIAEMLLRDWLDPSPKTEYESVQMDTDTKGRSEV